MLFISLLAAHAALAAVSGVVMNGTTGQPQSGATVTLYKFGQGGMEPVAHVASGAQGEFTFQQDAGGQGPSIVRVDRDGVLYNHLMPPGTPTTGFTVTVYDAAKPASPPKVAKHMILLEPGGAQLTVSESYLVQNDSKTTLVDPRNGTVHFYLPPAAKGNMDVKGTAPDGAGMSVPVPSDKTAKPNVYTAKFELKPGETRLDVFYTVPYAEGQPVEGRIASNDENSYLIVPNGVTLTGDGLSDLGSEPRTQAHIYGLAGTSYKVQLAGTPAAAPSADSGDQADTSGQPQIEQILPRVYTRAKTIIGLALGILAIGFALLYRARPAAPAKELKEAHERGRR